MSATSATTVPSGADEPTGRESISQAGEHRLALVESLRALGALSVVWFHIYGGTTARGLLENGTIGHPPFSERAMYAVAFSGFGVLIGLSGCLLYGPFVKQYFGGGDAINLRRYAVNRALRILPLYYVAVLVLLIASSRVGSEHWIRFLTMTENFSTQTAGTLDTPMWSVTVEVIYYILLPFLAWGLALAAGRSWRKAAMILLGLGLLSIAIRYRQVLHPLHASPVWHFSLPANFWFFVPGMILAMLRVDWRRAPPAWLSGPLGHSDLWLLAAVPIAGLMTLNSDLDPLAGVAAFFVIGGCLLPLRVGPVVRALSWKPLAFVGIASYSIYIWHGPLLRWLQENISWMPDSFWGFGAVGVSIVIAVSIVSYYLIEAPFLSRRRQWARSSARQKARA